MSAKLDVVVRGGQVVTSTDVLDVAIGIKDGKVAALAPADVLAGAERVIDARGKIVLPGAIDCHIHLGPESDDWRGGPIAAAHPGPPTLLRFAPYDHTTKETLPHAIKRLRDETERLSVLDFGFHFILANTPYILEGIPEAVQMGVSSFKLFMTYKKRPPRMCPDDFILAAMERIAKAGGVTQRLVLDNPKTCITRPKPHLELHAQFLAFPIECLIAEDELRGRRRERGGANQDGHAPDGDA